MPPCSPRKQEIHEDRPRQPPHHYDHPHTRYYSNVGPPFAGTPTVEMRHKKQKSKPLYIRVDALQGCCELIPPTCCRCVGRRRLRFGQCVKRGRLGRCSPYKCALTSGYVVVGSAAVCHLGLAGSGSDTIGLGTGGDSTVGLALDRGGAEVGERSLAHSSQALAGGVLGLAIALVGGEVE